MSLFAKRQGANVASMPQRHDRTEGGKREKTDCIAPSTDTLARIYRSSITAQDTRHQRSTISSDKVVATPLEASGVPGPSPALPHYLSTARRVAEPCARTTTPRFAHHHYNTHSHHMLARRVHHTHSQHVCNAQDIDSSGTPLPRSSLILQLSHRCLIPSSIAINSYHLCIFITHCHHTHTHTLQLFPYAVVSGDQPPRQHSPLLWSGTLVSRVSLFLRLRCWSSASSKNSSFGENSTA